MAVLTVRDVPDEVHRALRMQAAMHGRSTEAEVREILASTVKALQRVRIGDLLAKIGRNAGLTNEDFLELDKTRNKKPAEPMGFE